MNRYLAHTIRFARAPKSAARCSLRHNSSKPSSKAQSSLHRRRELEYPLENGVGDFLTPKGLRTIAVEWQEGLLQRLNDEVKDTDMKHQSVVQVVQSCATQKSASLAFMYASLALNNSFFLDNLRPLGDNETSHEIEISASLKQKIDNDFGGLTHLKSTMSAAALGMSTSGWVWLVQDANGLLGVVPTFGPGTVLVRNREQRTPFFGPVLGEVGDPREASGPDSSGVKPPSPTTPSPPPTGSPLSGTAVTRTPQKPKNKSHLPLSRDMSDQPITYNAGDLVLSQGYIIDFSKIGEILSPLFCISVHEHAWMSSGYGVWGKENYLRRFWAVLDWRKVSQTHNFWLGSTIKR